MAKAISEMNGAELQLLMFLLKRSKATNWAYNYLKVHFQGGPHEDSVTPALDCWADDYDECWDAEADLEVLCNKNKHLKQVVDTYLSKLV